MPGNSFSLMVSIAPFWHVWDNREFRLEGGMSGFRIIMDATSASQSALIVVFSALNSYSEPFPKLHCIVLVVCWVVAWILLGLICSLWVLLLGLKPTSVWPA